MKKMIISDIQWLLNSKLPMKLIINLKLKILRIQCIFLKLNLLNLAFLRTNHLWTKTSKETSQLPRIDQRMLFLAVHRLFMMVFFFNQISLNKKESEIFLQITHYKQVRELLFLVFKINNPVFKILVLLNSIWTV